MVHEITLTSYRATYSGPRGMLSLGTWGSYGREQLHISTDDSWAGLVVTAHFATRAGVTPVLVGKDGLVDVPPEATASPGMGNIVIDGTADGQRIYSVNVPYIVLDHADVDGAEPPPTPDKWEQYVAQVKQYADAAAASADKAAQAAGDVAGAVSQVQEAAKDALDDIATERNIALEAVQTEGGKQQSAITSGGAAALEAIGQTEQAAIGQVQQAGQAQLDKIAAANALVPTPTQEDAGKSIIVKSDGSGYELGDIVADAYTKAESDARYAPIAAAIRPTVSGNPATLEHSVAWAMQGLSVYGKSTQDGEPSPDNPVPIVSAGESGSIAVTVSDGADQSQQLAISTPNGLPGIPVDSGGNYTDENGQQWVCDEVDFARGVYVQRTSVMTYNGTEDWITWGVNHLVDGLTGFYCYFDSNNYNENIGLNTLLKQNDAVWGGREEGFTCSPPGVAQYITCVLSNDILEDTSTNELAVQSWKSILANKGMTAIFTLVNPIETPLSDEELAAYAALRSYNGTTIVSTEVPVAGLSARYVADGAAYIDGKIQSALAPVNRAILEVNTNV